MNATSEKENFLTSREILNILLEAMAGYSWSMG